VRSDNLFSKRDTAVLDAPARTRAQREGTAAGLKRAAVTEMPLRRERAYANDYADSYDADPEFAPQARRPALRISLRGGIIPRTLWGKIAAGTGILCVAGVVIAAALWVRSFVMHDEHFIVPNSAAIQISGNGHLSRAQLLSVFGEDVDRSVFNIPLEERRRELESLPWVAHATVMRLLPNRVRVAITERTPVAFIHEGNVVGLVDAGGALFDMPGPDVDTAGDGASAHYSFPVLSGIVSSDPISTRAARMKIYTDFMTALDADGENISHNVSEVNLSDPEDVQALFTNEGSSGTDILVHFGQEKYLDRYHQYQSHLAEWRAQYPKLASVDMRYEQQVVLQMQKNVTPPVNSVTNGSGTFATPDKTTSQGAVSAELPRPTVANSVRGPKKKLQLHHHLAGAHTSKQGVAR
jgi:cell division protein FtsQ